MFLVYLKLITKVLSANACRVNLWHKSYLLKIKYVT